MCIAIVRVCTISQCVVELARSDGHYYWSKLGPEFSGACTIRWQVFSEQVWPPISVEFARSDGHTLLVRGGTTWMRHSRSDGLSPPTLTRFLSAGYAVSSRILADPKTPQILGPKMADFGRFTPIWKQCNKARTCLHSHLVRWSNAHLIVPYCTRRIILAATCKHKRLL